MGPNDLPDGMPEGVGFALASLFGGGRPLGIEKQIQQEASAMEHSYVSLFGDVFTMFSARFEKQTDAPDPSAKPELFAHSVRIVTDALFTSRYAGILARRDEFRQMATEWIVSKHAQDTLSASFNEMSEPGTFDSHNGPTD